MIEILCNCFLFTVLLIVFGLFVKALYLGLTRDVSLPIHIRSKYHFPDAIGDLPSSVVSHIHDCEKKYGTYLSPIQWSLLRDRFMVCGLTLEEIEAEFQSCTTVQPSQTPQPPQPVSTKE